MTPDELRQWRASHGYTQADLADKLNVDRMTVARWEQGARGVPPFLHLALKQLAAPKVKA